MLGDERRVIGGVDHELVRETLRIGEAQPITVTLRRDTLVAEPRRPEVDRLRRPYAPHDAVHHAGARAAGDRTGVLEEGEVGPRLGLLFAVEEVVDARIVLVDGLRSHPEPEHARVEVDVFGRVARDGGDVVDAVEVHGGPLARACLPYRV